MGMFSKVEKMITNIEESIFGGEERATTPAAKRYRIVSDDARYICVDVDLPGASEIDASASASEVLVEWTRGEAKKGKLRLRLACSLDPSRASGSYVDGVLSLVLRKVDEPATMVKIAVSRARSAVRP